MKVVTIRLEGVKEFEGFDCRGQEKNLCHGCRLRFKCLTDRNEVIIPKRVVTRRKLTDLASVTKYMFSEGKISYTIAPQVYLDYDGDKQEKLVMRLKNNER